MNRDQWLSYFEKFYLPAISSYKRFVTHQYRIAGKSIRVHFSSPELRDALSTALTHREIGSEYSEDFEIYVFRRGELLPTECNVEQQKLGPPRFRWHFHGDSSVINLFCGEKNCGYYLISNEQSPPHWVISSPFRKIFDWYFSLHGIHVVHGAAVGSSESAVLITGMSGAGKSTIAMHCAAQGMAYLSDDYVAIDEAGKAHALYSSLKVLRNNPVIVENFGDEVPVMGDKRVLFLGTSFSEQLPSSLPLKGVIVPLRSHGRITWLSPLEKKIRERTLSAFALKQTSWVDRESARGLLSTISKLPAFLLEYQEQPEHIPPLLLNYCNNSYPCAPTTNLHPVAHLEGTATAQSLTQRTSTAKVCR